jgi:hypothetical protein
VPGRVNGKRPIHDFLLAPQKLVDFEDDILVVVRGKHIAKISDGLKISDRLQGEIFKA